MKGDFAPACGMLTILQNAIFYEKNLIFHCNFECVMPPACHIMRKHMLHEWGNDTDFCGA